MAPRNEVRRPRTRALAQLRRSMRLLMAPRNVVRVVCPRGRAAYPVILVGSEMVACAIELLKGSQAVMYRSLYGGVAPVDLASELRLQADHALSAGDGGVAKGAVNACL